VSDLEATTITLALSEAERASLRRAAQAYERGQIRQREIAPGVWVLTQSDETQGE
jgi:hypothetical protein